MVKDKSVLKKAPKAKKEKVQKTEEQLVQDYAKKIMNAATSTMVSRKDLHDIVVKNGGEFKKTATMLALDRDFYFSVVFQTSDQKYEFLKHFAEKFNINLERSDDEVIDIVNGLKLADSLKINLKRETPKDYPQADPVLLPFVLDDLTNL